MSAPAIALPQRAYIPGKTPRPAEGYYDDIRNSVHAGMTTAELSQSTAFRTAILFLEKGFYWEAHEVLEPVWMNLPESSAPRLYVQGMIQLANGFLKLAMGRPKAAGRLLKMSEQLLVNDSADLLTAQEVAWISSEVNSLRAALDDAI